jgi:hypothetical protein
MEKLRKLRLFKRLGLAMLVFVLVAGAITIPVSARPFYLFEVVARAIGSTPVEIPLMVMGDGDSVRIDFRVTPGSTQQRISITLVGPNWSSPPIVATTNVRIDHTFQIPLNIVGPLPPGHTPVEVGEYRLLVVNQNFNTFGQVRLDGTWTYTTRRIERTTQLRRDLNTFNLPLNTTVQQVARATTAFDTQFGIDFGSTAFVSGEALNGTICRHHDRDTVCSVLCCGVNNSCNTIHGRGADRLLRRTQHSTNTNIHTINLVGHTLCFSSGTHGRVGGAAFRSDINNPRLRDSIATTNYDLPLDVIIQHELTHNLGARDCNSPQCVMNRNDIAINRWCNICRNSIWNFRRR